MEYIPAAAFAQLGVERTAESVLVGFLAMSQATIPEALQSAITHHQAGRLQQADALYREILIRDPCCADALHLLGVVAGQVGRYEIAVDLIRRALELMPECADFHANLGDLYRNLTRFDEAVASLRHAIALRPEFPVALNNLGAVLAAQQLSNEAVTCYQQAIHFDPNYAEAHNNLGNVFAKCGQLEMAQFYFQQTLALKPDTASVHNNLSAVMLMRGQTDEALISCQRAIALKPDFAEAHSSLGNVFKNQGRLNEALACYRHAVILKPNNPKTHSDLILALLYHSADKAGVIESELRRWNEQHGRPLAKFIRPHANDRSPDRRLRIGYVSPDFRSHPIGLFLRPLLALHDRQSFEVFCYFSAFHPDHFTTEFRSLADHWREVAGLTDQQIADQVRKDRIDILLDLALHTANNRLSTFALKPAPVQATYLGYPGNSGLDTVDYRITDSHLDPQDRDVSRGTEQPIRLPETYWCYRPIVQPAPEVNPLPALTAGHVTFGCFNNFCKVTPEAIAAWVQILIATPNASLVLHTLPGTHRWRVQESFANHGVDSPRLRFIDRAPLKEYFQSYQSIDIALDPFPFPGGTTTCDALWMGVPVISLAGPTPVTRGGLSLLSNVGLPEFVAYSVKDYISKATVLAHDLPRLVALRAGLREQMQRSPLMDTSRFARNMEAIYRTMWRQWCNQQSVTENAPPLPT